MRHTQATARVILLSPTDDEHTMAALMAATVLADWFGAPLVMVTDSPDRCRELAFLGATLGVDALAPICFESQFCESTLQMAHDEGPSVLVGDPTPTVLDIASRSTQPTLLVADQNRRRVATGPLVIDAQHGSEHREMIALAASWATALDQPIQIVNELGQGTQANVDAIKDRLSEMGITAAVDDVRPHGQKAAITVALTRDSLALIVPNDSLDDNDTTGEALANGLSVLVAGAPDPTRVDPAQHIDMTTYGSTTPPTPRTVEILDHSACLEHLRRNVVGRLAYVSAGWPVILPVNYQVSPDGDLIIKSVVGGKTAAAAESKVCCFEIDGIDQATQQGWSVVLHGELEVVTEPRSLDAAWRDDPKPWIEGAEWRWLVLSPLSISGRQLRPQPAPATRVEGSTSHQTDGFAHF